jgi:hypothetical protein
MARARHGYGNVTASTLMLGVDDAPIEGPTAHPDWPDAAEPSDVSCATGVGVFA